MLLTLQAPAFMTRLFTPPSRPAVTRWFAAAVRQGRTREFEAPAGRVTVHCRNGEAWITHDGDPRDVMLNTNESYRAGDRRRMRVHALQDCVLEIQVDE
ncbi:MAG TPA: DUF2917 domain-containing protein [Ramlibacter sp.]|nr:DUF2917 domain-containing protein [Ramlibacter sp.]